MNEITLNILYIVFLAIYLSLYIPGTFKQSRYSKLLVSLSIIPVICAFVLAIMLHNIFNIILLIVIFVCIFIVLLKSNSN